MRESIYTIDLFAGPGGLAEGFASYVAAHRARPSFKIGISVERDLWAHRTLLLRSFFRQFGAREVPHEYYDYLRGTITRDALFDRYPREARLAGLEARCAELGNPDHDPQVFTWIERALRRRATDHWVLIGGPPCQAYSVIGRSRMRTTIPNFEADHRHFLYREYLSILAQFRPSVFVMENVKGLLSATVGNQRMFERITGDLRNPTAALADEAERALMQEAPPDHRYRICSLVVDSSFATALRPGDFVIRCEDYGIPQTRHRVILLGVREDIPVTPRILEPQPERLDAFDVLDGLPELRSHLSKHPGNPSRLPDGHSWLEYIQTIGDRMWLAAERANDLFWPVLQDRIQEVAGQIDPTLPIGAEFVAGGNRPPALADWYIDEELGGVCNHTSRGHLAEDLHRYLFAACYAEVYDVSPKMRDFPTGLLPQHRNIQRSRVTGTEEDFDDRFRVQVANRPATTITSHISKDGHYNIHYDPFQCRSLTVREAARIQTFPDNYFFEGPRTQQYLQVGNAVPPLLATQIARVVEELINNCDVHTRVRHFAIPRPASIVG